MFAIARFRMVVAACLLVLCACDLAQAAQSSGRYAGKPLADVLRTLQSLGLKVVFSSELVRPEMRVLSEPRSTVAQKILAEVLEPHGLRAAAGPRDTWFVVRARKNAEMPAPAALKTGTIHGTVINKRTGAHLPGVTVALQDSPVSTITGPDGGFRLNRVPAELQHLFVSLAGYGLARALVDVAADRTSDVTIALTEGEGIVEEVTVVADQLGPADTSQPTVPIVDVKTATIGTTFDGALLHDIPNQRDLFALLASTPGITMPRVDVGGNTAGTQSTYRAYGLAGQSITMVDGVNITSGSAAVGAYIDYGALAEVKIAAAGNSADVPVAGAAVSAVIKSGSNTQHGEFHADVKPGGRKPYNGGENFVAYRDINTEAGGPFTKDRLWYFGAFRDQYNAFTTGMYDKPAKDGGIQGQTFSTETTDYTLKLNAQLGRKNSLAFMTQWGRKYQPFRGGSGAEAYQYPTESTALQDSWSEIGKLDYARVINDRATLDTSANFFGEQFPLKARTDKTPVIDDVTFARSGAFNTPSFTEERRWHYNTDLNLYAGSHDIKIGYMYQWYGPQFTAFGAPGPAGTTGQFYIATTNGAPTSFWTDNGPVSSVNVLKNHSLFLQDKFQATSKLTLNVGVRFDRYRSSYPEQRFGVTGNKPCATDDDCNIGPFAVKTVTPARDVVTFNTIVPRVALIYDVFGNSKTALKASWGRFATNPAEAIASLVNPIDLITKKYAWDNTSLTANPAVAAARITPAYVATLQPIFGGAQLTPATVDPNLKDSYTDEFTFGAEQEIVSNLRGYVTVVEKLQKNTFGRYDRLRVRASYTPVRAVDPGPDGIVGSKDDRTITVFETSVPPDTTDYYLTNKPIGDTYLTIEAGVTKRMSGHWQLISAFDWTRRDLSSLFSEDPNVVAWNANNTQTAGWTFKASGSYLFTRGLLVGLSYNAMKGEPYARFFTVTPQYLTLADPQRATPLAQGNMTIVAEKPGAYYLPAINVIGVRAQKEFVIKETLRLHLMLDVFNLAGAETVTGVNQLTGTTFNQPTSNISGRVVRFGSRFTF